jgi:hypothetical protein
VVAALRYSGQTAAMTHPEWYTAAMGQQLFYPPNVAGWPPNSYWLTTAAVGARANFARYLTWRARTAGLFDNSKTLSIQGAVQQAFDTFGITEPSPATRDAMERWLTAERSARTGAEQQNLITLTLMTPDFQLA